MSSHDTHDHDREGELKRRIERHVTFLFIGHVEYTTNDPCQFTKKYYLLKVHKSTRHKVILHIHHRVLCEEDDATLFKQRNNDFFPFSW